jgi:hypothetical protein
VGLAAAKRLALGIGCARRTNESARAILRSPNGIGFYVASPNIAACNTVNVAPAGLEIDNSPFTWDAAGAVTGAEVADLDADGSP